MTKLQLRARKRKLITQFLENESCFRDYSFAPIRKLNTLHKRGSLKQVVNTASKASINSKCKAAIREGLNCGHGSIIFFI